MEHINKIELRGTVGTVRSAMAGDAQVVHFSLVTNILQPKNSNVETTWINVDAWSGSVPAETLNAIQKGRLVHLIGRLRSVRYTTANGEERSSYEVVARQLELVEDRD